MLILPRSRPSLDGANVLFNTLLFTGLALILATVLHWRADLWPVHAPANAR